MKSITSIASSGMNVAMLTMGVSAHNIANAVTPAFRRQLVAQQEQSGGGVSASVTQADEVGSDLAADAVQQITALYVFKANLRTVQVQNEMLGTLIDTRA
ncbi:MAG: flagellar basal body rod protein [Rhizobacter sp.]